VSSALLVREVFWQADRLVDVAQLVKRQRCCSASNRRSAKQNRVLAAIVDDQFQALWPGCPGFQDLEELDHSSALSFSPSCHSRISQRSLSGHRPWRSGSDLNRLSPAASGLCGRGAFRRWAQKGSPDGINLQDRRHVCAHGRVQGCELMQPFVRYAAPTGRSTCGSTLCASAADLRPCYPKLDLDIHIIPIR